MITEFTAYERVFMYVMRHNWDDGHDVLHRNLDGNYCDRGTALLIYWGNNPGFLYKHKAAGSLPEWAEEGYDMMKKIEQAILEGKYQQTIRYVPDDALLAENAEAKDMIPKEMYEWGEGKNADHLDLAHLFVGSLIDACGQKGTLEQIKRLYNHFEPKLRGTEYEADRMLDYHRTSENALALAVAWGHLESARWLLDKGAILDAETEQWGGKVLVHTAAFLGNIPMLELLLAHQADINEFDKRRGKTALHYILDFKKWGNPKEMKMLKFLLANGADPNLKAADGRTAFEIAETHGHEKALKILNDPKFNPALQ